MRFAFDVDGTLVKTDGKPNTTLVNLLRAFLEHNEHKVYVWSGGGVQYAQQRCRELGITPTAVIPKSQESANDYGIEVTFDDQNCMLGRMNIKV